MLGDDLLEAVTRAVRRTATAGVQVVFGVVTQASPLQVRLNGDTGSVDVGTKLDAYTAVLNDEVVLLRVGVDLIALGDFS